MNDSTHPLRAEVRELLTRLKVVDGLGVAELEEWAGKMKAAAAADREECAVQLAAAGAALARAIPKGAEAKLASIVFVISRLLESEARAFDALERARVDTSKLEDARSAELPPQQSDKKLWR